MVSFKKKVGRKWAESGQKVGRCQKLVEICKEK
jgi:hypothetical protein